MKAPLNGRHFDLMQTKEPKAKKGFWFLNPMVKYEEGFN